MTSRRQVLRALAVAPFMPGRLAAQQESQDNSMSGDGYLPVRRAPKQGARASLTALERDAVERRISCPCPCTLDVFTCRTSMPCGFAPRMHTDVMALVEGGYSADEILDAFVSVYGETARMAPPKRGFNLLGWFLPAVAIGVGGAAIAVWMHRSRSKALAPVALAPLVEASEDERARLDAAVRNDG